MLHFNFNWARPGRFFVGANYILSRSTSEADGPTALPADNLNMRGERGPSLNDARHRFFFVSNVTLWRGLRLGTTLQASSATPYNIHAGVDLNGDGFRIDLPPDVAHINSGRGSAFSQLDLRLSKAFRLARGMGIEALVEAFNVFNATNPAGYNGNRASTTFGQPSTFAGDPLQGEQRVAQLAVRFHF